MRCFVIGPIGDQLAEPGSDARRTYEEGVETFEEVIKAACASLDIEAYRADDIDDPGEIPEQVYEALRDEQLVIADLTGANPNVMYELGIRHALGHCTLQVGEKDRLPFDITTIRTIQFLRTPNGLVKAKNAVTKMIGSSLANGCKPSTAARIVGSVEANARSEQMPADDAEDASAALEPGDEPPGFLDALADVESAMPELNERLTTMSALIEEIGGISVAATDENKHTTTAAQSLAVVHRFTKKFSDLTKRYDQELVEFESRIRTLGVAMDVVHSQAEGAQDPDDGVEYLQSTVGLGEAAGTATQEGLRGFVGSLDSLENISRDLRPWVRLLRSDVQRTIAAFSEVERWGQGAAAVLKARGRPTHAATAQDDSDTRGS